MRYDDREQGAARSGAHEQVIRKLQQAGALLAGGSWERARPPALESSEATFHQRRNRYGRMKAEEAKRRRRLEGENKELKPLSAEADLAKAILREMLRHCQRAGKTA